MVEHLTCNQGVGGSSPFTGSEITLRVVRSWSSCRPHKPMRKPRGFESLTRYKNFKIYLLINICREISVDYFFLYIIGRKAGLLPKMLINLIMEFIFLYIKRPGWSLLSRRLNRDGVYSFLLRSNRPALFGMHLNPLHSITYYQGGFTATVFLFSSTKIRRKFGKCK